MPALATGERREIHDARPAAGAGQMRLRGLGDPDHGDDVDALHSIPESRVDLAQQSSLKKVSDIIHQDVDAAEELCRFVDELGTGILIGEVRAEYCRLLRRACGLANESLRTLPAGEVVDGDVASGGDLGAGDGLAQSLPATGYQSTASSESSAHPADSVALAATASSSFSRVTAGWLLRWSSQPMSPMLAAQKRMQRRPSMGFGMRTRRRMKTA